MNPQRLGGEREPGQLLIKVPSPWKSAWKSSREEEMESRLLKKGGSFGFPCQLPGGKTLHRGKKLGGKPNPAAVPGKLRGLI